MDNIFDIFPSDTGAQTTPGINQTYNSQNPVPPIASVSGAPTSIWDKISGWDKAAGDWVYNAVVDDYNAVKGAVGTVADDVTSGTAKAVSTLAAPVLNTANSLIYTILLAVVVIGGVLYYIFSTGNVKVGIGV